MQLFNRYAHDVNFFDKILKKIPKVLLQIIIISYCTKNGPIQ